MAATVEMIDPMTLRHWQEAGEAYLVDVREDPERAAERIAGSQSNPLSRFDPQAVAPPAGQRLVLQCRSAVRCGVAAEHLIAAGHQGAIYRLNGGLIGWKEAGLPTETDAPDR